MIKRTAIAAVAAAALFTAAPAMAQGSDGGQTAPAETATPGTSGGPQPGSHMMPGMMEGQGPVMNRERMRGMGTRPGQRRHARGGMMGNPMMMRMLFVAVDTDASGTLSLEEVLALHERMFNAADADGDGELAPAEMRGFMRGGMGG